MTNSYGLKSIVRNPFITIPIYCYMESTIVFSKNKNILRYSHLLLVILSVLILIMGFAAYSLAAVQFKKQLALKCQALAATVAAVIAEDSSEYTAFLQNMDMESDYYRRTKALMQKIKNVNLPHVEYIYTTKAVDENTVMYVIGGEDPSSPAYSAPGVKDTITKAERIAYDRQQATLGEDFEDTAHGVRLGAYHPIFHKYTGEFLGLVGVDVIREQYNGIMHMFLIQTVGSIFVGFAVFALATYWFFGKVNLIVNRQRFAAYKAERKLATEKAILERINRMKNDLMDTISHEARTPLAVLASYAGLVSLDLKRKGTDMETATDLDKIVSETQRVADLIDGMNRLAFSEGNRPERTKLDFGELVQQIAKLYRPLFERNGLSLHLFIKDECLVLGISEELTQVVFNIIQNAKDHTEQGSVSIHVNMENGNIVTRVTNTGAGISPALLPNIFERGVKGDGHGAGLGLAICKEIMDAHSGTITITSENGVTVTLTLPEYREENSFDNDRAPDTESENE